MKRFFVSVIFLLTAFQVFSAKEINRLDSLMSSIYRNDQPGAAIAVVKDGKVVFKKGYGLADLNSGNPVTPSTNFNICSLTKQFTAYLILKLAEENRLSPDDRIDKYFPDFKDRAEGKATIRQLMSHCSGIIDHYDYVNKALYKEFRDKDVLDAIKSVDSVYFQPGTAYRYSNTAFCLLSLIIEQVSGNSFPGSVREYIFKPLKMDRSDVINPDFRIPERALGYESDNGSFKLSDAGESLFFSTMGDGGIYTSVNDYLKWINAIQNGKVLNRGIVKNAQSPQFPIDKKRNLYYGFGWFVAGSGDSRVVYHTGSNGGFRTIVFMIPSRKYSVIIFSNRTGIDLEDLVGKINRIFKIDDSSFVRLDSLIS